MRLGAAGADEQPWAAGGGQSSATLSRDDVAAAHVDRLAGQQRRTAVVCSRSRVMGESTAAPTWRIQSWTPWPSATVNRPGNSRASVASSMAASAGLRNGTGSSPMPTVIRVGPGQRGRGRGQAALEEAVLPQPQLVDAGGLGGLTARPQLLGRALRPEHHAGGVMRCDSATAGDRRPSGPVGSPDVAGPCPAWPVRVVLAPERLSVGHCKRLRWVLGGRGAPWGGSATVGSRPLAHARRVATRTPPGASSHRAVTRRRCGPLLAPHREGAVRSSGLRWPP